jgi:phage terminase large subunit-like protein
VTVHDHADFADLLQRVGAALKGDEAAWARFIKALPPPVLRRMLAEFFLWQTHEGQHEPTGGWRNWLVRAGRGLGKTLVGAHWVTARARETPGARIALVGASVDEVAKVMIEGETGLFAAARAEEEMLWVPTQGVVTFASGAQAFVHSAAAAEKLRGPQFHFAWCDELAKWEQADAAWDNLQMGLRLGTRPRAIVTTTPRAVAIVRRIRVLKSTVETVGRTADNVHLSAAFTDWAAETYGGTRLGRQELDAVLFDEPEGALFPREILERARHEGALPAMKRIVVGVDPPASAHGDACGIVVCGLGEDDIAYVLADASVAGLRPDGWARAVARAAADWQADRVIAEKNQGGDMVESVLMGVDAALPVRLVSASRGKAARAEPIAARFESGRAKLAGRFPALEDELAGLTLGGGYEGPGRSPDRADAMVWAMSELQKPPAEPRIRRL